MKEKELREAESRAKQQTFITESELSINIQTNQGKAEYERSGRRPRASRRWRRRGREDSHPRRRRGQAHPGDRRRRRRADGRVGIAQAMAIEEQVRAYGGPRLQLTQQVLNRFAEAIQASQVDVVPKILIAGQNGKDGGSPMTGNVMEALLTLMLSERLGGDINARRSRATRRPMPSASASKDDMKR
jgi:hypothetical protein